MKALVLKPATKEVSVRELPIPEPSNGEVLIRVHAVALNPVDANYVLHPLAEQEQRIIGTDFAGIVTAVGPDLGSSSDLRAKVGARVAGFHQGACSTNDRPGAFAEYITAPYDLLWAVPDSMSLEAASTISMCGLTAAQGVFARLGLPCPFDDQAASSVDSTSDVINVLIYSASTSLGLYAAQMVQLAARSSGRKIRLIGTASPSKHEFLRQEPYKYDVLVDYRDPNWAEKVKEATEGRGVDRAADTISEGETVYKVHDTLKENGMLVVFRAPKGGHYDPKHLRIKPIYNSVWEGLGHEIGYNGITLPANPKARVFATKFFNFLSTAATDGKVKVQPNPVRLMPGGLERIVPDGFALLGGGMVSERSTSRSEDYMRPISGEKLVYRIVDEGK
ncbi:GroES-like protein [Trichoderma longibrachiatum]|uniref:GroES-like protein n=1 Tax=Trichoderma longibrachiatum ATCC 18648 TaxID=983965 RepID=A0A2T4BTM0_TRILO|nr:GroES-like protein [Trichoderma longibrachiatum ATCC 18648]